MNRKDFFYILLYPVFVAGTGSVLSIFSPYSPSIIDIWVLIQIPLAFYWVYLILKVFYFAFIK